MPKLAWWNRIEKPSISRRNSGLTASGVTSRGEKPVPPVEMIRSTPSVLGPRAHLGADRLHIVADDRLAGKLMTSRGEALDEQAAGFIASPRRALSDTVRTAMRSG